MFSSELRSASPANVIGIAGQNGRPLTKSVETLLEDDETVEGDESS